MTKTQAIKQARTYVSKPVRVGGNYVVYGPFKSREPHGIRAEYQAESYSTALALRTHWVARVALALMNKLNRPSELAIFTHVAHGATIESCVDAGLNAEA